MRISVRSVVGLAVFAAILSCAEQARADELKWLGVHGAYYTQYEQPAIGFTARQDVGDSWSVGFLVDYVIRTQRHTTWVAGADLQWETVLPERHLIGWVGAGGGVLRDDPIDARADFSPFASGFVGIGLKGHPIMPYLEMRIMSNRVFHGVIYAGVRF